MGRPSKTGSEKAKQETKEVEAAKKLSERATEILRSVEEGLSSKEHRVYPTFEISELGIGPLLGIGGFGIVREIISMNLVEDCGGNNKPETEPTSATTTLPEEEVSKTEAAETNSIIATQKQQINSLNNEEEDHHHYELDTARQTMKTRCLRNGEARYAIKQLAPDLSILGKTRGMIDLAMEVKFLSVMWHPNIVKMRGFSSGDLLRNDCFIVMDRLFGTVEERFQEWIERKKRAQGFLCGCGNNSIESHRLLLERVLVLYDMASALTYMHQNQLVYRDIKRENIGFDIRGDVKVFDFGLTKCLLPSLKATKKQGGYGYNLTPVTGSIPYMAPEILLKKPYGTECDVFSFAIFIWEVLSLRKAFVGYSLREYLQRVATKKERLSVPTNWPSLIQSLVTEAWNDDPRKRPNMKRIATMIRGDLNSMSEDSSVQDRTKHMKDRSSHSVRGFN